MKTRARLSSGFTLLELMVASTVGIIVLLAAMLAWTPMSRSSLLLRERAVDTTEMRMAVEWLLADFGAADEGLPDIIGDLLITREQEFAELEGAWAGSDPGIRYTLLGDILLREDLALDTSVVVSTGITLFDVQRPGGVQTTIDLGTGSDDAFRAVRLVWPE